jgi:surface carbohydrate biosynthesis protein
MTLWNLERTRITFFRPSRAKILIVDAEGSNNLIPLFNQTPYEILYLRNELWNLNIFLWLRALIAFLKFRNLRYSYARTFIQMVKPSVVITFIDNNSLFWRLDQTMHSAQTIFMTVQNGRRSLDRDHGENHDIFHSNFFCFGEYEKYQYTSHGAKITNFYPIGSLRDSYYREIAANSKIEQEFDIVLISDAWYEVSYEGKYGHARRSFDMLCAHLRTFLDANPFRKAAVACRNEAGSAQLASEIADFRKWLGNTVVYMPNRKDDFGSYRVTDAARLILGGSSTLLSECFGRMQKILSCNFSADKCYDFPVSGIWSLNNAEFQAFYESVKFLLLMENSQYVQQISSAASYVMGYNNEFPTHHVLQAIIAQQMQR